MYIDTSIIYIGCKINNFSAFILLYPTFSYYITLIVIIKQILEASMRPLKEKISITIDNDIVAKIKDLAEADDRSFSQYINMVLKDHIQKLSNPSEDE